ncbi:DNA-binding response regulator, partial [Clostridium perfringens]|nr:DNA-binding response regulator [Clostridium perfringens]
ELLEITEEEQKYMTIIISKKEYKRRDRVYQKKKYQEQLKVQGKLSEKQKIYNRRKKIKVLLDKGLKQKDICLQLNISKLTYIRDRKFLKEQGLI